MSINPKLLNEGERVVVSTRTHVKVLLGPLLVLLLIAFATSYLAAVIGRQVDDDTLRTAAHLTLAALGAAALVAWVVRPFLTWFFTTYTFTDRRFIQRSGDHREGRAHDPAQPHQRRRLRDGGGRPDLRLRHPGGLRRQ